MNELDFKINIKNILKFSLPSIIAMIISSIYSVVDGIVASNYISNEALAAVNIIYPIAGMLIAIGTMIATGTVAIVSAKMGMNKNKEARENLTQSIVFTVILSLVLMLLIYLFRKDIALFLGADKKILNLCLNYLTPLIFFFPMIILQMEFGYYFVANGKPNLSLISSLAGGLTNVILDVVLTKYCHYGIVSISIASGIGYTIGAMIGLIYFLNSKKDPLYLVKPKYDGKVLLNTLTNGSSEMVTNISSSITMILFNNIMMQHLGVNGVSAIGMMNYIDFILIALGLGYAQGISPVIGYNYGKKDQKNLHLVIKNSLIICSVLSIILTIAVFIFKSNLIEIFTSKNTEVYKIAIYGISIYFMSYLFKILNVFTSAMFTALSNGKISALLSFIRTLVLIVLFVLLFVKLFGINGLWYALPTAEFTALIIGMIFVKKYKKVYNY